MIEAQQFVERAQSEPPDDLRAWVWSLAPFGKRVLVAAAGAVLTPAIEAWRGALREDPTFADCVGDDLVLVRARDAVLAWLDAPTDAATAQLHAVALPLTSFLERVWFVVGEVGNRRAGTLARCVHLAVSAASWSEDDARRDAAGDAAEEASRIAAGPAFEAGEAVALYAGASPEDRARIVGWIAEMCTRIGA